MDTSETRTVCASAKRCITHEREVADPATLSCIALAEPLVDNEVPTVPATGCTDLCPSVGRCGIIHDACIQRRMRWWGASS